NQQREQKHREQVPVKTLRFVIAPCQNDRQLPEEPQQTDKKVYDEYWDCTKSREQICAPANFFRQRKNKDSNNAQAHADEINQELTYIQRGLIEPQHEHRKQDNNWKKEREEDVGDG